MQSNTLQSNAAPRKMLGRSDGDHDLGASRIKPLAEVGNHLIAPAILPHVPISHQQPIHFKYGSAIRWGYRTPLGSVVVVMDVDVETSGGVTVLKHLFHDRQSVLPSVGFYQQLQRHRSGSRGALGVVLTETHEPARGVTSCQLVGRTCRVVMVTWEVVVTRKRARRGS